MIKDSEIKSFTLSSNRIVVKITNYGARITHWLVDGVDVILGFDDPKQYTQANEPYHGAVIGRYANRIANASYQYNGVTHKLDENLGKHILHGGPKAYHNTIWEVIKQTESELVMKLTSPDGDQGFPGNVTSIATYAIDRDRLSLEVETTTDQPTPINITHHPYFNLSGINQNTLDDHTFKIHSDQIIETNEGGIPTGKLIDVKDSAFDFNNEKMLTKAWAKSHPQIELLGGIDHTYICRSNDDEMQLIAEARSLSSGIHMKIRSNQPGVQFYTANHFDGSEIGKKSRRHEHRGAFCLEPQHYPDSPNSTIFPSTILNINKIHIIKIFYIFY